MSAQIVQNAEVKRTQKFIPLLEWLSGEKESETLDFSAIDTIPMEFFAHIHDVTCPYEEAIKLKEEI